MSEFNLEDYSEKSYTEPSIPLILLLDCSSSMDGYKIQTLNECVRAMINDLQDEVVKLTIISFDSYVHTNYIQVPIQSLLNNYQDLFAGGCTNFADAVDKVNELISNNQIFLSTDKKPIIVVISDGAPTDSYGYLSDNWKVPVQNLINSPRGSKAIRLALAIGEDSETTEPLQAFVAGSSTVSLASNNDAQMIKEFFNQVTTMTKVAYRTNSQVNTSSARESVINRATQVSQSNRSSSLMSNEEFDDFFNN